MQSLHTVGPILAQREAYVDLWCSCQIGDAYIDLSIHLFDTYTRSKVNAAPPLNPNLTPRDDRTQSLPYTYVPYIDGSRKCVNLLKDLLDCNSYIILIEGLFSKISCLAIVL